MHERHTNSVTAPALRVARVYPHPMRIRSDTGGVASQTRPVWSGSVPHAVRVICRSRRWGVRIALGDAGFAEGNAALSSRHWCSGWLRRFGLALFLGVVWWGLFVPSALATGYGFANPFGSPGTANVFAICSVQSEVPCRTSGVPGPVSCPKGFRCFRGSDLEIAPTYASALFSRFDRSTLHRGGKRSGYARFSVPYDALDDWDSVSGGCRPSAFFGATPAALAAYGFGYGEGNGGRWFAQLVWNVQGAEALGLQPDVVFSAGSGVGTPLYPDPLRGAGSRYVAGLTLAGKDYSCGTIGIIGSMRRVLGGEAPRQWEAFNEPDIVFASNPMAFAGGYNGSLKGACARGGFSYVISGSSAYGVPNDCGGQVVRGSLCGKLAPRNCGALEAVGLWEILERDVNQHGWGGGLKIAALTASAAQSGWSRVYERALNALHSCAQHYGCFSWARRDYPQYWAVHDYDDPTAMGDQDLRLFENDLAQSNHSGIRLRVWITESGVWLADHHHSDRNLTARCPALGFDPANTLGTCVQDEQPRDQYRGGKAWLHLHAVSARNVVTTETYWFEFSAQGEWDSALTDNAGIVYPQPAGYPGTAGRPRPAYCAITGYTVCAGSTDAHLSPTG